MAFLRSQEGIAHGEVQDTERTYVEIHRLGDLMHPHYHAQTDWSNLGMILTAILAPEV